MRPFKFDKPMVESHIPPTSTNVLWVDKSESTGEILSIKEFIQGQWKSILSSTILEASKDFKSYMLSYFETDDLLTLLESIATELGYELTVIENNS